MYVKKKICRWKFLLNSTRDPWSRENKSMPMPVKNSTFTREKASVPVNLRPWNQNFNVKKNDKKCTLKKKVHVKKSKKWKIVGVKHKMCPWKTSSKWPKTCFTGTFHFHGERKRRWLLRGGFLSWNRGYNSFWD